MLMSSASKGPTNYFKASRSSLKNMTRSNLCHFSSVFTNLRIYSI